ncbi:IclR family transcriptional regulator [Flavisphingomonas formosensis]|uniref:IclR family transcriptional regulator n=1 Tax=Flavisphingomonas formosensis TaxID=861534 RepID=UPI0012FC7D8D|nr:helix-turn-helix domain-containing protein [Sphingomonas formosensis]
MLNRQAANVLDLVEYFARRRRPATIAEIADDNGWPRSSAFNIVSTLADRGYLYEPAPRGGYYPSPRWLAMARATAEAEPLPDALHALVDRIAVESGETTAIGAPAGTSAIFIHVVESPQPIRYFAQPGHRLPIQATATGRALLTQMSRRERDSLYRKIRFERHTDAPPGAEAVEAEIAAAAARGYHRSIAEYSPDLLGVALPVPLGGRLLSLTIAGPVSRCFGRMEALARLLADGLADLRHHLPQSRAGEADAT